MDTKSARTSWPRTPASERSGSRFRGTQLSPRGGGKGRRERKIEIMKIRREYEKGRKREGM
jgi:hypothetical protein